jgi:hypothetical protein
MLLKEKVLETVASLQTEFTIDELFERLSFIENVQTGLEDIKNGDMLSEIQLENEIKKWRK